MLQRAKFIWDNNLVIQRLTHQMKFKVKYKITDKIIDQELWISCIPGAVGLLYLQTLRGGYLELNSMTNSPGTIAKQCKELGRPQRDCILEWAD